MNKKLINEYNSYIIEGGFRGNVPYEHAMYHERLFDYPNNINQIQEVIELLKRKPNTKRAQASLWYPLTDIKASKAPCLQILWFRIKKNKLEMHAHMRANDVYKKLLMNLNINAQVMKYVAEKLELKLGKYIHIIDSAHIYNKDKEKVEKIL